MRLNSPTGNANRLQQTESLIPYSNNATQPSTISYYSIISCTTIIPTIKYPRMKDSLNDSIVSQSVVKPQKGGSLSLSGLIVKLFGID